MDKLKLMKTANEVRKGIVTSVHSARDIRADPCRRLTSLRICISRSSISIRRIRRRRTGTVSSCPKAIRRRGSIPYWRSGDISRKRT